jgi:hypothetical protein
MGYFSKIQVIQRGEKNRQYYLICPSPLAQALEMEKGEIIEWVVQDKKSLILRRGMADGEKGRVRRGRRKGFGV